MCATILVRCEASGSAIHFSGREWGPDLPMGDKRDAEVSVRVALQDPVDGARDSHFLCSNPSWPACALMRKPQASPIQILEAIQAQSCWTNGQHSVPLPSIMAQLWLRRVARIIATMARDEMPPIRARRRNV